MEGVSFQQTKPLISSWSSTPVPSLSLSAAGLLALADLQTVAQRTVITGGSSWLDALVLAPGLHYQQAVDALDQESEPGLTAVIHSPGCSGGDGGNGQERRYTINNAAMVQYIRRLWQEANTDGVMTLDVGVAKDSTKQTRKQQMDQLKHLLSGMITRRSKQLPTETQPIEIDWLSHVFYMASPVLTIIAGTFMVLLADWWGLAFIVALMISRILNIWSIKQRSRPQAKSTNLGTIDDRRTEYAIDLGNGSRVVLRGLNSDLQAMTTHTWLRSKSTSEGYLEATAKLIVYLVASFSGNQTQAGAMVLMALLLTSAGLLGLSNAHARGLQMNGRVARLQKMPSAAGRAVTEANGQHDNDSEKGMINGAPS